MALCEVRSSWPTHGPEKRCCVQSRLAPVRFALLRQVVDNRIPVARAVGAGLPVSPVPKLASNHEIEITVSHQDRDAVFVCPLNQNICGAPGAAFGLSV